MAQPDRRLEPRHPAGLQGRLGFAPSRVLDLGFGGALVETCDWIALGQRSTLRLGDPAIHVPVFVVYCRLVGVKPDGRPVYQAGLRFDDSPAVRQQLGRVVAMLARDHVEAPVPAFP